MNNKYNVGDEVCFISHLQGDPVIKNEIIINVTEFESKWFKNISYCVYETNKSNLRYECDLFKTKNEAIDHFITQLEEQRD